MGSKAHSAICEMVWVNEEKIKYAVFDHVKYQFFKHLVSS